MTNPSAQDLYERLGIASGASESEVKAAFFSVVRMHPPEKDPENYKLIREAYDTLHNAQSRQEYDSRKAYGPDIEALELELMEARDREDTVTQIRILKKLVILLPDVGLHRNRLGLLYMDEAEYGSAVAQFLKALSIDSRNPTYILNCGHAYEQNEQYKTAYKMFKRAWDLDPEDYAAPRALASLLYFHMEEKGKAYAVLDKAILADDKVDFQDFFCMHDKIMFYVFERDEEAVESEINRISSVTTTTADRDFASYTFASLAYQLIQLKGFRMAQTLAEAALSFNPNDEALRELVKNANDLGELEREVDRILERTDFPDSLKFLIATLWRVNFGDEDDPETQEQKRAALDALPAMMNVEPNRSDIDKAIAIINSEYSTVWKWQDKFFRYLQEYTPAEYFMLVCMKCKNEARANISAKDNAAGLKCPECYSTGPFGSTRSSFKNGDLRIVPQKSRGDNCFIATATYRRIDHPDVRTLKAFRDEILIKTIVGRLCTRLYYRIGPAIARLVWPSERVAFLFRVGFFGPLAAAIRRLRQFNTQRGDGYIYEDIPWRQRNLPQKEDQR